MGGVWEEFKTKTGHYCVYFLRALDTGSIGLSVHFTWTDSVVLSCTHCHFLFMSLFTFCLQVTSLGLEYFPIMPSCFYYYHIPVYISSGRDDVYACIKAPDQRGTWAVSLGSRPQPGATNYTISQSKWYNPRCTGKKINKNRNFFGLPVLSFKKAYSFLPWLYLLVLMGFRFRAEANSTKWNIHTPRSLTDW